MPLTNVKISQERQDAKSVYYAEVYPIDAHIDQDVAEEGDFLPKPKGATHLELQTISAAIRYTIDESPATITHGFRLAIGSIVPIPCGLDGINVFREGVTKIQGQWFR